MKTAPIELNDNNQQSKWLFCCAPMLDLTTSPCRQLYRQFNAKVRLYSEMISTGAIIYGDAKRYLYFDQLQHPIALQLAGSNLKELAQACNIAAKYNYDEINLNVGCPSERVQNNNIGACLMRDAHHVARCLTVMTQNSDAIVSIKHRLAIDSQDESEVFKFVDIVANKSPCKVFIVHARRAWLQGLNSKQNRNVPPLRYDIVYELKRRFPELQIIINGGITTIAECKLHLQKVDGVMLGRAIYQNPQLLAQASELFGELPQDIYDILPQLAIVMQRGLNEGIYLHNFTRHLMGLFNNMSGARKFRRILSEQATLKNANLKVWENALQQIENGKYR